MPAQRFRPCGRLEKAARGPTSSAPAILPGTTVLAATAVDEGVIMAKAIARLVTLALLLWTPCASDSHWRFVTGVVTDKRGNGLAHAVVQLEDEITLSVRSYITGDDGRYHFSEVNADIDYHLRARYRMHWSKPHSLSRFDSPKDHDDIRLVIPVD